MSELEVPVCQHIKANGDQCELAALHGRSYCHFHDEAEKRRRASARTTRRLANRTRRTIDIPVLEDANAVQIALMEGIHALIDQRLDRKDAALLFYALQTAGGNVKYLTLEQKEPDLSRKDFLYNKINKLRYELKEYDKWESSERYRIQKELEQEFRNKIEAEKIKATSEPVVSTNAILAG